MSTFSVLMYHEIIKKEDYDPENQSHIIVKQDYCDILPKHLFVFLEEFEKQIRYLYENNYSILKLQDIMDFYHSKKPIPEKAVLITFDDMYKSVLLYAYPILKKYGFTAVGFVVLDWLFDEARPYSDRQSVCLSRGELDTMRDVFEYACHSGALHTRKDGTAALQTTGRDAFIKDTAECCRFVDIKDVYAYPFGVLTEEIVQWLKELKFKLAFGTVPGKNTAETDPFKIHRNCVLLNLNIDQFAEILVK